jgi:hypothetical protein
MEGVPVFCVCLLLHERREFEGRTFCEDWVILWLEVRLVFVESAGIKEGLDE